MERRKITAACSQPNPQAPPDYKLAADDGCCGSCFSFFDEDALGEGWCRLHIALVECGHICRDFLDGEARATFVETEKS